MEVAHVERHGRVLVAEGTQLGAAYELRYRLSGDVLSLEVVDQRSLEVSLGAADFFDLGWSPLFDSLPVIRDDLLAGGPGREYLMRWVDVPSLDVRTSRQRHQPLAPRVVRYRAGGSTADIRFDEQGFVVDYPGLATRL